MAILFLVHGYSCHFRDMEIATSPLFLARFLLFTLQIKEKDVNCKTIVRRFEFHYEILENYEKN